MPSLRHCKTFSDSDGRLEGNIRHRIKAGFIEQSLSDCDRRACAEGKIEGIAWSAVEFLDQTITIGYQPREEGAIDDSQYVGSHNANSVTIECVKH